MREIYHYIILEIQSICIRSYNRIKIIFDIIRITDKRIEPL